ncbi:hypothetical protein AB0L22_09135 [Micromonospora haikouensis]|uniref:hypothetical protein n=1 Tax=Micromonospora haikouensis TaxID=686309 RepID=UPI003413E267
MVAFQTRRPGRDTRSRPASWAPPDQWRLYRAWGDLPRESGWWARFVCWLLGGWQQLLYIGVTERTAIARWAEHLKEKRWAPDIACWERDDRVWSTEADVLAVERAAIIAERPVHNVQHNGNNPGAVRVRRHLPRHVVRARLRWAARACVWVALFVGCWLAAADVWHGWDAPRNSAVAATILGGLAWWGKAQSRRPMKRRRTSRRRR